MQASDAIRRPVGLFDMRVFRRGTLIEHYQEPNLVVDLYRTALSRLLGNGAANDRVGLFGVGESATAAAAGNTSLVAPYQKAIDGVLFPTA